MICSDLCGGLFRHLFFGCQTHFCLLVCFSICFRELTLHQLDINNAFLHDDLQEKLYIENPSGFVAQGKYEKVCILKKPRYGWKQSRQPWFGKLSEVVNLIWKWVNVITQSSINNQLTLSSCCICWWHCILASYYLQISSLKVFPTY